MWLPAHDGRRARRLLYFLLYGVDATVVILGISNRRETDKMNKTATSRCTELVTPALQSDERIELVEAVQIGKISAERQVATAVAVAVATAGIVMVALKPRPYFLVLTDQRLILIENLRGRVGKMVAAIPRSAISAEPLRAHLLTLSMEVTLGGTPQHFSWGRVQTGMARRIAAALST